MNENKRVLGSNFKNIDTHVITPDEYEEIPELEDEFFENAIWNIGGNQVSPETRKTAAREAIKREGPKDPHRKVLLSVRYSPEVVDYFRATGSGWQARMDEVLKEWVKVHREQQ